MVWLVGFGAYIVCMFLAFALCRVTSPSAEDATQTRPSKVDSETTSPNPTSADHQTGDHRVAADFGSSVYTSPMA